jgi:uncharacterized protein (TIGR00730 family)
MKRVCIFCGANAGAPSYGEATKQAAEFLVQQGLELVYGGGSVGLMGVIADAALTAGGKVIGVIPHELATRELLHTGLTDLHVVESMHERKALMAKLSDAFIALPGGFGTLDELFEILTWGQLGQHTKPVGLLNLNGYFNKLLEFIDHTMAEAFVKEKYRELFHVDVTIESLWERMKYHQPPKTRKWINLSQT